MDPRKAAQYMSVADHMAETLSKDPNKRVACLMLAPGSLQILSCGYNGMPRGIADNDERWQRPQKYHYVEHAERNAIYNAGRQGTPLEGAIVVSTLFPCCDCVRALIQVGAVALVTRRPDFDNERWGAIFVVAVEMLQEGGIEMIFVD